MGWAKKIWDVLVASKEADEVVGWIVASAMSLWGVFKQMEGGKMDDSAVLFTTFGAGMIFAMLLNRFRPSSRLKISSFLRARRIARVARALCARRDKLDFDEALWPIVCNRAAPSIKSAFSLGNPICPSCRAAIVFSVRPDQTEAKQYCPGGDCNRVFSKENSMVWGQRAAAKLASKVEVTAKDMGYTCEEDLPG